MRYLILGFNRSGTNMMMHAAKAGGMTLWYDQQKCNYLNEHFEEKEGYHPNPMGFLESSPRVLPDFPDDMITKVPFTFLDLVPMHEYKAVYMKRDINEIIESHQLFYPREHKLTKEFIEDKWQSIYDFISRRNISYVELEYDKVVANPIAELSKLDWPWDVEKAASAIDAKLYRNKNG